MRVLRMSGLALQERRRSDLAGCDSAADQYSRDGSKRPPSSAGYSVRSRKRHKLKAQAKNLRVLLSPANQPETANYSGGGGIRTHGTVARTTVFETASFGSNSGLARRCNSSCSSFSATRTTNAPPLSLRVRA